MEDKIGVFICTGYGIAEALDVDALTKIAEDDGDVAFTRKVETCEGPGLREINEEIRKEGLTKVVIAGISPRRFPDHAFPDGVIAEADAMTPAGLAGREDLRLYAGREGRVEGEAKTDPVLPQLVDDLPDVQGVDFEMGVRMRLQVRGDGPGQQVHLQRGNRGDAHPAGIRGTQVFRHPAQFADVFIGPGDVVNESLGFLGGNQLTLVAIEQRKAQLLLGVGENLADCRLRHA